MILTRLRPEPGALIEFYEQALTGLGALCERTWHDRLQVLAEGRAAQLWNPEGGLHEVELSFPAADSTGPRDAAREVFPGCPLTTRIAESLRPPTLTLERAVLQPPGTLEAPAHDVAARLWRSQFPEAPEWQALTPFTGTQHFSLLALVRCELQAIDQHWSLHRLVLSLPEGAPDDPLAEAFPFASADPRTDLSIPWPTLDLSRCQQWLQSALQIEIAPELARTRARQQRYLDRELNRIDDYFDQYEAELTGRARRSRSPEAQLKVADRLAAARAERTRRHSDQIARHEIRLVPHLDALMLVAEPAWTLRLRAGGARDVREMVARFVPRLRRWFRE